jgi:diguanylate cyclase
MANPSSSRQQSTKPQIDSRKHLIRVVQKFAGSSPEVTDKLNALNALLRRDLRSAEVDRQLEELSETIVHAGLPQPTEATRPGWPEVLAELLDGLQLPGSETSAAVRLSSRLHRKPKNHQTLVKELAAIINRCACVESADLYSGTASGDLGSPPREDPVLHLLSGLRGSHDLNGLIEETLQQLSSIDKSRDTLAQLDVLAEQLKRAVQGPSNAELSRAESKLTAMLGTLKLAEPWSRRAKELETHLRTCHSSQDYLEVIDELADVVRAWQEGMNKQFEELTRFLKLLSGRLDGLRNHLTELAKGDDESLQHNDSFDQRMRDEVRELQEQVSSCDSLESLKTAIQSGLNSLEDRFKQFVAAAGERAKQRQRAAMELQNRLESLESETVDLRARIEEEAMRSLTDHLTGIGNRLAYQERMGMEFNRWQRYQAPLSLALFDIDHLKPLHDSFGHNVGDRVLRSVARQLADNARSVDFVARYGGEEFVVILPSTTLEQARQAADKLRRIIDEVVFKYDEQKVPVTVSAGVAELAAGDSPDTLLKRADDALYRAKRNGRNRCVAEPARSAA